MYLHKFARGYDFEFSVANLPVNALVFFVSVADTENFP